MTKSNSYTKDSDLIEISGNYAYNLDPEKDLNSIIVIDERIYKVIDFSTTTSGFKNSNMQAVTLRNYETNEIVIAYQGTQTVSDIVTDISLAGSEVSAQLKDANSYYAYIKDTYKDSTIAYTCGNSLGGGLSNYVATQNQEVKSVTYNPAILPEGVKTRTNDYESRIKNYIGKFDPLTLLEIAAGFEKQIPGEHIPVNISIPGFDFMIANHVGYLGGDKNKSEISMGAGYTPIRIDVASQLPFSLWDGRYLGGAGGRQSIEINKETFHQLQNGLVNIVGVNGEGGNVKLAEAYLADAKRLVEEEKGNLGNRQETLHEQFDETINETPLRYIISVGEYKEIIKMLGDLTQTSQQALRAIEIANSIPVVADAVRFILRSNPITNMILLVGDAFIALNEMIDSIYAVRTYALPKLFTGMDELFEDGVVELLCLHYDSIDEAKGKVRNKLTNFSEQVDGVYLNMEEADESLAKGLQINYIPVPDTDTTNVEANVILKDNMQAKKNQLESNYEKFSASMQKEMHVALGNLQTVSKNLYEAIEDVSDFLKGFRNIMQYVKIPFTSVDNDIRYELDKVYIPKMEEYKLAGKGLVEVTQAAYQQFGDILRVLKPYVKNAIFSNHRYGKVIAYNLASRNIYTSTELMFEDVRYGLSEHMMESIQVLSMNAEKIEGSINKLNDLVTTGTIE